MTAIAILGLVALVGATVAWTTWHRVADERRSVTNHQHALDTLRHLGDHRLASVAVSEPAAYRGSSRLRARPGPSPARRGITAWHHGDGPVHVPAPASRSHARRHEAKKQAAPPERAAKAKPRRRPALVFVDDGAEDEAGKNPTKAVSAAPVSAAPVSAAPSPSSARLSGRPHYRSPWAERLAPEGAAHPRRHAIVAAGVSAVALAVVLAVTIPSSTPTGGHHRSGSSHDAVTPLRGAPAPGSVTGATTSIAPSPADVSPTASTAHSAGYTLSGESGYTLAIVATGLCWVMATAQPTGALVWTGTLVAGQSRSLPVSGSVQVRLGAASDVTVSMNGRPVALPPGYQSPFDMNFDVNA